MYSELLERRFLTELHLDRLRDVHFTDFNMRKTSSRHLLKVFIVAVEEVGCIHTNTDNTLKM